MKNIDLDPLVRIIVLTTDHLTLIQNAIDLAQVDRDIAADKPLHNTGDNLVFLVIVIGEQALALRLANLLKDYILRVLDGDPAECP